MKVVILTVSLLVVFGSIFAGNLNINDAIINAFQNYISNFNVQFQDSTSQSAALSNFQNNYNLANNFIGSFSLTTQGKFSLLSFQDFKNIYLTINEQDLINLQGGISLAADASANTAVPDSLDLRNNGIVTAVKDQGKCGCCWAFSASASIEGAYAKKYGTLLSFSEQQILSCTGGNDSCNGGVMHDAYKYIQGNGGLSLMSNYAYTGAKTTCNTVAKTSFGMDANNYYKDMSSYTVDQLKAALFNNGPISVGINGDKLQLYKNGIYSCDSNVAINHAVTIVGYGSSSSGEYWIVKNSWGSNWGISGYFYLSTDSSKNCGLNKYAVQPILV